MTKFNWEKANSNRKIFKSSIAFEQLKDRLTVAQREEFDINNNIHNPLGLSDEDCTGLVPSPAKRMQIFRYLLENDENIRKRSEYFDNKELLNSKEFIRFCWIVFLTSLDWSDKGCELKNIMPIAVCFSVTYLRIYNEVISTDVKAKKLTPEIFQKINIHIATEKGTTLK
jgi:hypothetical protein